MLASAITQVSQHLACAGFRARLALLCLVRPVKARSSKLRARKWRSSLPRELTCRPALTDGRRARLGWDLIDFGWPCARASILGRHAKVQLHNTNQLGRPLLCCMQIGAQTNWICWPILSCQPGRRRRRQADDLLLASKPAEAQQGQLCFHFISSTFASAARLWPKFSKPHVANRVC